VQNQNGLSEHGMGQCRGYLTLQKQGEKRLHRRVQGVLYVNVQRGQIGVENTYLKNMVGQNVEIRYRAGGGKEYRSRILTQRGGGGQYRALRGEGGGTDQRRKNNILSSAKQ